MPTHKTRFGRFSAFGKRKLPQTPNKPSLLNIPIQSENINFPNLSHSPTIPQPNRLLNNINFPKLSASPTHLTKQQSVPWFERSPMNGHATHQMAHHGLSALLAPLRAFGRASSTSLLGKQHDAPRELPQPPQPLFQPPSAPPFQPPSAPPFQPPLPSFQPPPPSFQPPQTSFDPPQTSFDPPQTSFEPLEPSPTPQLPYIHSTSTMRPLRTEMPPPSFETAVAMVNTGRGSRMLPSLLPNGYKPMKRPRRKDFFSIFSSRTNRPFGERLQRSMSATPSGLQVTQEIEDEEDDWC